MAPARSGVEERAAVDVEGVPRLPRHHDGHFKRIGPVVMDAKRELPQLVHQALMPAAEADPRDHRVISDSASPMNPASSSWSIQARLQSGQRPCRASFVDSPRIPLIQWAAKHQVDPS